MAANSVTDATTGAVRSWTVPAGVTEIRVTAEGGSGGLSNAGRPGGAGATASGVFTVVPGQLVTYIVGQQGRTGTANDGGGGGSTGVFVNGTLQIVAGGGAGYDNTQLATGANGGQATNNGQNGRASSGCLIAFGGTGGNGGRGGNQNVDPCGTVVPDKDGGAAGGGVNSPGQNAAGGAGGGGQGNATTPTVAQGGVTITDTLGTGANGGSGFSGGGASEPREAGAGGGYSGGGGANSGGQPGGGGSWFRPGTAGGTLTAGANSTNNGNGSVTIEWSTLTLVKQVTNDDGGTAVPADFTLRVSSTFGDQTTATAYANGNVINITSNLTTNTYTVSEDAFTGYTLTSNSCSSLVHTLASIGTDYTCTLVNNDILITINAQPETFAPILGSTGGTTAISILASDTLNGVPITNPALVTISGVSSPDGLTLNASNQIVVPAGTPAGPRTLTYTICEAANPTNCDTQTETVNVLGIDAVAETFPSISSATGGTTTSILASDTLNGSPIANPALVSITVTGASGGLTLNASNQIVVPAGLATGPYTLTYQICEVANPTNCDTVTETVNVGGIDAVAETFPPVNAATGGTTTSILASDTLNGVPITNPAQVNITVTGSTGGLTLDASNQIVVPAGLTPGPYTLTYQICDAANPTICDTVTETVTVGTIDAVAETFPSVNSATGGTTTSILASDSLNGVPITNPALVTITVTGSTGGLTLNASNQIVVPAGLAAGPYTLTYQICEAANPTNCDTVTETVTVGSIDAVAETFPTISAATGGTTTSVLASDTLNGVPITNPALVTVAVTGSTGGLTLNASNQIVVPPGLTPGPYTLTYQICEVAAPANCDTVTETVTVVGIVATDDAPVPIVSVTGGSTPTVLANDTLNGAPATPANVTITPGTAPTPAVGSITMNPSTGIITVAAGTTPGTYSYPYTICSIANPAVCDNATATVVVALNAIAAVNDSFPPVTSASGGTTPSVLTNDTLNGVAVVPANIALTPGPAPTPAAGSITMNPDGTITIAPGTTPATYSYPYTICEVAQPANCATAIATVTVGNQGGPALVTDISRGNAPGSAVTVSVINNDNDPAGIFNPATLQILGTAAAGDPLVVPGEGTWTVNLANGTITFTPAPGFTGNPTPIQYQLQDVNGNLIAPAFVIILYEATPAFVCSEIIGKVFEDPNFNGRQDDGEKGMPGVRLATVNGKIITTDQYGRYHVPCAMIPKDIGSNFLLKVDPRSLPSGFRFTTENPRVVRLSQGMMSRMNFGVALSNLVEVDLSAAAFATSGKGISRALDDALATLAARIAGTPSVVRLNYHVKGEDRQVAKARLDAVEAALRDHWRGSGRYKLVVEQTLVRPK